MFDIGSYDKSTLIEDLESYINGMHAFSVNDVIKDFLGKDYIDEISFLTCLIKGIDHYGVYIGDYSSQNEIDELAMFLQQLANDSVIQNFEMGPSYIAAKNYLTQGWWFNITLADFSNIELFTCIPYGIWNTYSTETKYQRMSHVALLVNHCNKIKLLVDYYYGHKDINVITYTANDSVGHTYCHLINKLTNNVIEFIYHG